MSEKKCEHMNLRQEARVVSEYTENLVIDVHCADCGMAGSATILPDVDVMWDEDDEKSDCCPCGGIILADTEDWDTPLCHECWEKMGSPEQEPEDG